MRYSEKEKTNQRNIDKKIHKQMKNCEQTNNQKTDRGTDRVPDDDQADKERHRKTVKPRTGTQTEKYGYRKLDRRADKQGRIHGTR